jgi:cytochrome P450
MIMSSLLAKSGSSSSGLAEIDPDNVVQLDPGSAEFKANAHRHVAEWARRRPFYIVGPGQHPQVVVGRYADVRQVFSDAETFASGMPRGPGWEQFNKIMDAQFVTQMDGEQHARVRRLLMPAFSSRRIAQLEESIGKIVDGMLDRIEANGPEFDGMKDYGAHLVVHALLDAMINMDERRKAIFIGFHDLIPGTTYVKPGESWAPELRQAFDRAMEEIKVIIDERRVTPRSDFISDLVNARDQGDKLNDRELFDQIFGICGASLSATSRAAGGALYLLYTHDDQRRELIDNASVIPDAIEECLRLGSNGYFTFPRIAMRDTEVGGTRIPKGTVVRLRRSLQTTIRMFFPTPCVLTFIASHSGSCHSVQDPTTALAIFSGARRSPSQSRGYWRAFRRPASAIAISSQSTAEPWGNCDCKACRC